MPNETRIATWREPPPAARQTLPQFLYAYWIAFALTSSLPILALLLGVFPSFALFCAVCAGTAVVTGVAMWLLQTSRRNYVGDSKPLPDPERIVGLASMNAVLRFEAVRYPYGQDRGELTIVDHWLVFEGERTSFSVSPDDVENYLKLPSDSTSHHASFALKGTGDRIRVRISSLDLGIDPAEGLEWWLQNSVKSPRISVLPPLKPMPGFRRGDQLYSSNSKLMPWALMIGCCLIIALPEWISIHFVKVEPIFYMMGLYLPLTIILMEWFLQARSRIERIALWLRFERI